MAGLLITAERRDIDIGVVLGERAVGLANCELLDTDTNLRAAARVGEEMAEIGDCALGVVFPDILIADT